MQAYTGFAAVYDTFMDNIPYEEWCEYLTGLLKEQGVTEGLLLDLGCGTGSLTELLADAGYDMIGVDNSGRCWKLALEKKGTVRKRYFVSLSGICGNLNFTARWRRWSPSVMYELYFRAGGSDGSIPPG